MSQYLGAREAPLASTKKDQKLALRDYSFPWIKWLVDKLFPARTLNLEGDRDAALPTRR
jgi:hypothetical protein